MHTLRGRNDAADKLQQRQERDAAHLCVVLSDRQIFEPNVCEAKGQGQRERRPEKGSKDSRGAEGLREQGEQLRKGELVPAGEAQTLVGDEEVEEDLFHGSWLPGKNKGP